MIRLWLGCALGLFACSNSDKNTSPQSQGMMNDRRALALDGSLQIPADATAHALLAGDLDGDGHPDLLTNGSAIHAFLNRGDGSFAAAVDSTGTELVAPVLGDFNGDAELDVAVTHRSAGMVGVLLGNGDGTFQVSHDSPTSEPNAWSLAAGDLDQDGKLDLVAPISSVNNVVDVLKGNGDGSFQTAAMWTAGADPEYAAIADLDGSGALDVVATNWVSGNVSVALGRGDGSLAGAVTSPSDGNPVRGVAIGDLSGDGKPDVVVGNGTQILIFVNDGNGGLKAPVTAAFKDATFDVAVADFDGDGHLDVAALALDADQLGIFLGNGDGSVGPVQSFPLATVGSIESGHLAIADFDGDHLPDVAVLSGGVIRVFHNASR
jgi:hypothetical protein